MTQYSIIEQGMLMILQRVAKLLEYPRSIKYDDIWSKTDIEPKYWRKLINGGIIRRTGSPNKPMYQWVAIEPNIYMASETLKDVAMYDSKEIFIDENDSEYKKTYRKQVAERLIPSEENIKIFERTQPSNKELFIKDHLELCRVALNDNHKTDSAKELIRLARHHKLYSINTVNQDVFSSLQKHYTNMKHGESTYISKDKFTPPSLSDVEKYCNERQNDVNPAKFISYYEQKGWKIGKEKMKDWKKAVITWEKNNYNYASGKKISDYTIEELTNEFKRRGYTGTILPPSNEIKF